MSRTYNLRNEHSSTPHWGPLIAKIKERVKIDRVADTLGITKKYNLLKTGASLQGDCPTGHTSANHRCFSIDTNDNFYHCFSCNEAGDIISLVELSNHLSFMEAVKYLVDTFVPGLSGEVDAILSQLSPEEKAFYERGKLYRAIFDEGKKQLAGPIAKDVADYLVKERGYDPAKLPLTEFIYLYTEVNIRAFLNKKFPAMADEIKNLPLQGAFGDQFRLAIPFRDRNGVITGFMKRAHTPKGFQIGAKPDVRWDSTTGLKKSDLFGLHRIRKQTDLVIVEGYPDATYFPALGMDNVVALGQGKFSNEYFYGLETKGIKRIILALDNDGVGTTNSVEICKSFAESDIQVFVIDPPALGGPKDPDEYVKANGIDAFKVLVNNAESASKWMVKQIIASKNIAIDLERNQAIDEVLQFAVRLNNPVDVEDMLKVLTTLLNLTPELLAQRYEQLKEKNAEEQFQSGVKELSRITEQMIREGEGKKAGAEISTKMQKLIVEFNRSSLDEEEPLEQYLIVKQQADKQRLPGSKLGYTLDAFPLLDEKLSGLQSGLYIIAADPNIGKTMFLLNLSIDLIKSNNGLSLNFYTMDDSRDAIINRILAKLTGIPINEVQCKPAGQLEEQLLDKAYQLLSDWVKSGRLNIRELNESLTMESIQAEIKEHKNRKNLVVVIDGLYNVPMQGQFSNIREENIDRAMQVKEIVKFNKIPVIATA